MSNLHIIFTPGNPICLRSQPCDVSIVQGDASQRQDYELTNFTESRTVVTLPDDYVLNIIEVTLDGKPLSQIGNLTIDGFRTDLTSAFIGFNRSIDKSTTVEISYDYVEPDTSVNDDIQITTDASGIVPSSDTLNNGSVDIRPTFDEAGVYELSVTNLDDSSIPSANQQFEVIKDILILESSDGSLTVASTLNGLDTRVNHIDGFQPLRPSELNNPEYLMVGSEGHQGALDSAKDPESNNPFVTAEAVIDVLEALGEAVDTKDDLRNVDINNIDDKEMRLVKSTGSIYFFDGDSQKGDNGSTVLKPDDLSSSQNGRWERAHQESDSHSNLNDLSDDDHTHYLNSERHANEDHSDLPSTINSGQQSSKPNSSESNRYYYSTDKDKLERDSGSGWETLINFNFVPTSDQKDALAGTSGSPSSTNKYITEDTIGSSEGVAELDSDAEVPMSQLKGGENDGLATLDSSGLVESDQVSDPYKKHFVEDSSMTQVQSGFSNTSYTAVDLSGDVDSNTSVVKLQVINQGGSATEFRFRRSGTSLDGPNRINLASNGSPADSQMIEVPINGTGKTDFKVDSNSVDVYLVGYYTTT
jgi:hypothetical protein